MSELLVGKCWDVKARVQRMLLPTSEAAWELYSYYEDEAEQWLERQLTEFKQPFTWDWQVTPKSQLVRMYQVFYARGVVLDSYDKLYMPAFEQAVTNVERLQICCEAHGHTPHDIKDARENLRDLLEAKAEELGLMCEVGVGPDDIPLVSDYGMDPLINAALSHYWAPVI